MKANSEEKRERLARALRENLKRRKAKARTLGEGPVAPAMPDPAPRPNKAGKPG